MVLDELEQDFFYNASISLGCAVDLSHLHWSMWQGYKNHGICGQMKRKLPIHKDTNCGKEGPFKLSM